MDNKKTNKMSAPGRSADSGVGGSSSGENSGGSAKDGQNEEFEERLTEIHDRLPAIPPDHWAEQRVETDQTRREEEAKTDRTKERERGETDQARRRSRAEADQTRGGEEGAETQPPKEAKKRTPPSTPKFSLNSFVECAHARLFARNGQMAVAEGAISPHPPKGPIASSDSAALRQTLSARATPTKAKSNWKAAAAAEGTAGGKECNKSCSIGGRDWTSPKAAEREETQQQRQRQQRESRSLGGSRESVALERPFEGDRISSTASNKRNDGTEKEKEHWQLFAITLQRASQSGFGIAISGGPRESAIVVSDVIKSGPAFGLLQVGDRIISVNGCPLEHANYTSAVAVMKDAQQLNMVVKRRVPVPFVEFEQRTLKFTLSKSRKKDDFGIVLGCRFFIKEILNPKLAEKEPGLKEGDTVLRVNGQTLDGFTLDEASRLLQRSREKLSLVVQRDVRRGSTGSRWPSQTTVYERLGSVQGTPRQSPTPVVHYAHSADGQFAPPADANGRKCSGGSEGFFPGFNRYSDPMATSAANCTPPKQSQQNYPSQLQHQSPYLAHHRIAAHPSPAPCGRPHSQTPSSMHSLNNAPTPQQTQTNQTTPHPYGQQQRLLADQQQKERMFAFQQQNQFVASHPSVAFQQRNPREMHSLTFHKGSHGLGIRVIGGNQSGIFVSAVQENSPADKNGIRVGDRIHVVNGVSMVGVTREEAFDFLLSTGEQPISMTVEHASAEEYSQVKTGKFGDNFYVRTHFAHKSERGGASGRQALSVQQQQPELAFQPGDIFHVTDTLFGGSPGYWQVAKVYSATDAEPKGGVTEPGTGVIPHAKAAETILARQRQAEKANGGAESPPQIGGTLGKSLFRKKLSLSSRKLFGGGNDQAVAEDVLSAGSGAGNSAPELLAPAYERVALKQPAFHRPVVLYGPLADVARQLLLSKFPLRFGAPFPQSSSATIDPLCASTSSDSQRTIPLSAVDAVMAAQKHCVMSVTAASVERLQLAQYAPIVILIDVESRGRVRELRSKAGANAISARKLLEQSQRIKKHHQHMLTATLDASKEDQWFDALRQLIFHLQERRVWMPEFPPECPLDDLLLFPIQQPGETPTSDSAGDYGTFEPGLSNDGQTTSAAETVVANNHFVLMGKPKGEGSPFLVPNPMYTLNLKQKHFGGVPLPVHHHYHHQMSLSVGSESAAGHQCHPGQQSLYCSNSSRQSEPPAANSAQNYFQPNAEEQPQQQQQIYMHNQTQQQQKQQQQRRTSPKEGKSQFLAQLANELGGPTEQQQHN